jgi:RNA recognition motif-containing protein
MDKDESISEEDKNAVVDDDIVSKGSNDSKKERKTGTNPLNQETRTNRGSEHPIGRLQPLQNKRTTSNTLFMTGISSSLSKLHIEKLFGKFGNVQRVDIKTSKTGAIFCFCEMDSIESAQKAMDNLNGRMLLRKQLVVQPAHERIGNSRHVQVSSTHTNPIRERRMLDRKIEELKQKINQSKR